MKQMRWILAATLALAVALLWMVVFPDLRKVERLE